MRENNHDNNTEELRDVLIAISVIAKRLADRLEEEDKESKSD